MVYNYTWAQDPHFTQFYAQPLYLNPAFAGTVEGGRLIANFRSQWPSLESNFKTYAVSYDQYFPEPRLGLGILLKKDQQTSAGNHTNNPVISGGDFSSMFSGFQNTDISLLANYVIPIKYNVALQAGLGATYTIRDAGWNNFIFANQINVDGSLNLNPSPLQDSDTQLGFFDIAAGMLLYTRNLWIGLSIAHITGANAPFISNNDRLPAKYSVHAGYKMFFDVPTRKIDRERNYIEKSITPVINYFRQGSFDQLSLGAYGVYGPIIGGIWYRGLPIKLVDEEVSLINHDAIAIMAGFGWKELAITYSYDQTLSGLAPYSGGSHEIAIRYIIKAFASSRPENSSIYRILCPSPSNFTIRQERNRPVGIQE